MTSTKSNKRAGLALALAFGLGACAVSAQSMPDDELVTRAIVGVRIIPSPDVPMIGDGVILIEGDRIREVGARASVRVPPGAETLDWQGATVLAGFWNSHVHLTTPAFLQAPGLDAAALETELTRTFTRWGFTTVFDLASTTEIANAVSRRIEQGEVAGPRVLSVAEPFYPQDGTPIYARPFFEQFDIPSAEVSSPEQARERGRQQIADGADGLKLFTGSIVSEVDVVLMPAEIVSATAGVARERGLPVFAHPTDRAGLERAIENGVTVLAHAAPGMGEWPAEYAQMIAARKVAMTPTLSLFAVQPHPSTPVETAVQQTRALYEAGGLILFGTDAGFVDEFSTLQELVLLEQAVGTEGVFVSLTTGPADLFGDPEVEGRVAEGFVADLVAVNCDPRGDVRCLADVRHVMRGGRLIYSRPATGP